MLQRIAARKGWALLVLFAVWTLIARIMQEQDTLQLPIAENSPLTRTRSLLISKPA